MDIHVLSVAEGKQGYWVAFSDDENLRAFRSKLETYASELGPRYDFFDAIDVLQDIPIEKKIGKGLRDNPLGDVSDFIDIELWRMNDVQKNEAFINELQNAYSDRTKLNIHDRLITKSFVLIRVKLTKETFDDIIQLKEIARADRPSITKFNPFEYFRPDVSDIEFEEPAENAVGVLVVDSGIISNHPMLEKCIGGEENFQNGEEATHDTVGHGTAVSGLVAYGDIEKSLVEKKFKPENWIFSAKVMYAEQIFGGQLNACYDPNKLVEHQFKDAVDQFLSNTEFNIKVVNISLGNVNEIWNKNFQRQLPLAALIDELAIEYPGVVFIISTGNVNPSDFYDEIGDIKDNYPSFLTENDNFKIINPATSALALSVGSLAHRQRIENPRYGDEQILTPIAEEHYPSPFTRTGFGVNGMVKPELMEYGGNLILFKNQAGWIKEDKGGKIAVLNNSTVNNIVKFDVGTSFSAPKVAHLASKITSQFPTKSANYIKNLMLIGADYPFNPSKEFYSENDKKKAEVKNLRVSGYGHSRFERAIYSQKNRVVLLDEDNIGLNKVKIYSLQLPEVFFSTSGKKRVTVTLTFNPETRSTRGDSYLGNRMEFHLFHSIEPQVLLDKYGVLPDGAETVELPDDIKKKEIELFPGANIRKAGCHQKAWKDYIRQPKNVPTSPISLVLLNFKKWIVDDTYLQDYCISVVFEHEQEIELYNAIRANVQTRARVR
nr:S8 family peptidase [uncultured Draconibacterium sp.]